MSLTSYRAAPPRGESEWRMGWRMARDPFAISLLAIRDVEEEAACWLGGPFLAGLATTYSPMS
jgi:hypothetical protein